MRKMIIRAYDSRGYVHSTYSFPTTTAVSKIIELTDHLLSIGCTWTSEFCG